MSGFVGLEQLRVLVVGHRLRGVDLAVEQGVHVEVLLHDRVSGGVGLGEAREELPLVAEAPAADLLVREVLGAGDAAVGPRDLQRAAALEDLRDVRDVRAGLDRCERLRHPRDREVDVAGGEHVLRHDVDRTGDDLDVEAEVLPVAVRRREVVAAELRLGEPLQLQGHRRELAAAASVAVSAVGAPAGTAGEHERGGGEQPAAPASILLLFICIPLLLVGWCVWCTLRPADGRRLLAGRRCAADVWSTVPGDDPLEQGGDEVEDQPEQDGADDERPRPRVGARSPPRS